MASELTTQGQGGGGGVGSNALVVHHGVNQFAGGYGGGQGGLNNNNFVIVELHRDDHNCPSFGFNIKGGVESGEFVYFICGCGCFFN